MTHVSRSRIATGFLAAALVWPVAAMGTSLDGQPKPRPKVSESKPKTSQPESRKREAAKPVKKAPPPSWLHDSSWYYVVVSRFHNGDPSNDLPGTLPWTAEWPMGDISAADPPLSERRFGGDLAGLEAKLPYLKALGVNTLCLSPVFQSPSEHKFFATDWRHIDDSYGVKGSYGKTKGETEDPKTWVFNASDRKFLAFVKSAHSQGFRVVVQVAFGHVDESFWVWRDSGQGEKYKEWRNPDAIPPEKLRSVMGRSNTLSAMYGTRPFVSLTPSSRGLSAGIEKHVFAIATRWMDPDGDGDPSDGIDGWMYEQGSPAWDFWHRWRAHMRKINPSAALVVEHREDRASWPKLGECDVVLSPEIARTIAGFLSPGTSDPGPQALIDALRSTWEHGQRSSSILLNALGGQLKGRARTTAVGASRQIGVAPDPGQADEERARLKAAMLLQHFLPGAPMTYYGDEVGMHGRGGVHSRAPMWWKDLPNKESKAKEYRGDFASLIQWLHIRRGIDEPLRHGRFRSVLLDDERKILAVARTMAGKEAILVLNYGKEKQKVMLEMAYPGETVGLMTPVLKPVTGRKASLLPKIDPSAPIKPLPMGASRQHASHEGLIRVWVDPMGARVVLREDRRIR